MSKDNLTPYADVDGPDPKKAHKAVQEAKEASKSAEALAARANAAFSTLRSLHEENHFVDKLRLTIKVAA